MDAGELREQKIEWLMCSQSAAYFIDTYVMILNATDETWVPFKLWTAQHDVLAQVEAHRQIVNLKARQLGMTWLHLAYALWKMIFQPIQTIGIFSLTETAAQELLDKRLKGMYERLPRWMQARSVEDDNKGYWQLSTGSTAMAFATNGGRQYTFSIVLVDEADFQPNLANLLSAVKPTIDAGGRIWLLSSSNKDDPNSRFKRLYREAKRSLIDWRCIFLPWHARPERTPEWYVAIQNECMRTTGALDDVAAEYPETDAEALAPRSLDKRIPSVWLRACYAEMTPLASAPGMPALSDLEVYAPPIPGHRYVIGGDPAEGNPNSDPSAATVVDLDTGEECAALAARLEPAVFAAAVAMLSAWYNDAAAMIERNNHGHTVILWLHDNSRVLVLEGPDEKAGWLSNSLGKTRMYTEAAELFRDGWLMMQAKQTPPVLLHSEATYTQLASIEGATLLAPKGDHDDRADSYTLANVGRAVAMQPGNAAIRQSRVAGRGGNSMVRRSTRRAV